MSYPRKPSNTSQASLPAVFSPANKPRWLEAAVEALRNSTAIPMIPEEHTEAVEQGIASAIAGRAGPMTKADWEDLRNHARQAASKRRLV